MTETVDRSFDGRVAMITGGSRGVGAAVVERFLELGTDVVALSRSSAERPSSVETRGRFIAVEADVTDATAVNAAADTAVAEFGRLDVLVCAAGTIGPAGRAWEISLEDWRAALDTNLLGTHISMSAVVPQMLRQEYGRIVNFASTAALHNGPGQSAYNASKAAVVSLTESFSNELAGTGINVNCVCPGLVDTEMISEFLDQPVPDDVRANQDALGSLRQEGRIYAPHEVVDIVVFLASQESVLTSGQFIRNRLL